MMIQMEDLSSSFLFFFLFLFLQSKKVAHDLHMPPLPVSKKESYDYTQIYIPSIPLLYATLKWHFFFTQNKILKMI